MSEENFSKKNPFVRRDFFNHFEDFLGKIISNSNNNYKRSVYVKNTALLITLSFLLVIAIGTILLSLPIARCDGFIRPLDSAFTATSAVCVTGLTVVDIGITYTLFGQIVILVLIQIGGLGYMTLAVAMAVIMGKKLGITSAVRIMQTNGETKLAGVGNIARNMVLYTFTIEAIGAAFLFFRFSFDPNIGFGFKAFFFGIFHSISAFCNAGMDLLGPLYGEFTSLSHYKGDLWIGFIISTLIIFGGIGYAVFADLIKPERKRKRTTHTIIAFVTTIILIVLGTVSFLIFEWNNKQTIGELPFWLKVFVSYFESVTCRTAGFSSINIANANLTGLWLLSFLMYIGACPASTGGGIKTTTIAIIYGAMKSAVTGKTDVELCGRRIPQQYVNRAIAVAMFSFFMIILMTVLLTFTEQKSVTKDITRLQFEVVSALGTVGLTTGITPTLSVAGKFLVMFTMFIGRIGSITLFNVLVFSDKKVLRRLPEDDVVIG